MIRVSFGSNIHRLILLCVQNGVNHVVLLFIKDKIENAECATPFYFLSLKFHKEIIIHLKLKETNPQPVSLLLRHHQVALLLCNRFIKASQI